MKEVRKPGRFSEWKFLSIFITDAAMNMGRRAATLCLKGLFLELTSLACDWAVARRKAQCIVLFLVAMRRKPLWIFEKAMCNNICATLHVNRFYNCLGLNPRSNKQTNKLMYDWAAARRKAQCIMLIYSHLSNKRDVTLTDFGKFHPAQNKNPPCTFIDFITKN